MKINIHAEGTNYKIRYSTVYDRVITMERQRYLE